MSCKENRTHYDSGTKLHLCGAHAYQAKAAGAEVSLAPGQRGFCQWKDSYEAPEPDQPSEPEDQDPSNTDPAEEE